MEKKGFSTRHFSGREAAHSGVAHTRKSVLYTKKIPHKDEKEFSEHKTQYLEIPHKIPQNRRPAPLHRPVEKPSRYHGNKKSPFMQKTRKKSSPERTLLKRQRAKILTISLLCIFAFSACDDSESDSTTTPGDTETAQIPETTPADKTSTPAAQTPEKAAEVFFTAYKTGDYDLARSVTSKEILDGFGWNFTQDSGTNPTLELHCPTEPPISLPSGIRLKCFIYYEGGGINLTIEGDKTKGYFIKKISSIAD